MLDLRGNGGGLLQEAVLVASIFIEDGLVVSTDGRTKPEREFEAEGDAISDDVPLVVLVDGGSASASEIVTGALRDRRRATIVGTRTFGKGVFQEVEQLSNGGVLDLTVGQLLPAERREHLRQGDQAVGARARQAAHRARRGAADRARRPRARGSVSRPRRRSREPLRVGVLAKKGRFLVAEPLYERGAQVTVDSAGRSGA